MGFRFRKRVSIFPGVRVNLGLNGVSVSAGPRGASITAGKRGVYANAGVPGSGISFREKIGGNQGQSQAQARRVQKFQAEQDLVKSLSEVKVVLEDDGKVLIKSLDGEVLSGKSLGIVWSKKGNEIYKWLSNEVDNINGDVELLENIHYDTPSPLGFPKYNKRLFQIPEPQMPTKAEEPAKPISEKLTPPHFFQRLFSSSAYPKYLVKVEESNQRYESEISNWKTMLEDAKNDFQLSIGQYQSNLEEWKGEKQEFDRQEKFREANFATLINNDIGFMEEMLGLVFEELSWPRETTVSYQVDDNGKKVLLDVDLPEIEDLPQKEAKLAASNKRLLIKDKSQKSLRTQYASHIHGILFRVVGATFATLPKADEVLISGFSQRLNAVTGHTDDEYLLSARVFRDGFKVLNHDEIEQVNPMEFFASVEHQRKMTQTGIFKGVVPLE